MLLCRTYMEQGAKKKVHLSDRVYNKLKTERDRPKSPTLRDTQHYILPQIEESFSRFWAVSSDLYRINFQIFVLCKITKSIAC